MNMDAILRSLQSPQAHGYEGPRPPEYYDARQELAGDDMGLDMLRRSYQPAPRETFTPETREDFRLGPMTVPGASIDALIAQLAGDVSRMPARNFGQGLARGFVRGAIAPQVQGMREREQRNVEGRQRVDEMNRDARMEHGDLRRAAMRMALEGRTKRLAESRRPLVPVPGWMAQAMGRQDLIGQSVPEAEWSRMRGEFDDLLQWKGAQRAEREANRRAEPGPEKPDMSKSAFINAMAKRTNLLRREQQLTSKLNAMDTRARKVDPERANRLQDDLDKVQAELESVDYVIESAPETWRAPLGGGQGDADGPGAAAPQAAAFVTAPVREDSATVAGKGAQRGKEGEAAKLSGQLKAAREKLAARLKAVRASGGNEAVTDIPALRKQVADLGKKLSGLGYSLTEAVEGVEVAQGGKAAPGAAGLSGADGQLVAMMRSGGITSKAQAQAYLARYADAVKQNGINQDAVLGQFQ